MSEESGEQRTQLDDISQELGMFGGRTSSQIVRPLWLIFAGGLIYCITFGLAINSYHDWTLHLTDQPIGVLLICVGLWQLARIDVDLEYTWLMRFNLAVAVLQIVATVADFFSLPKDPLMVLMHIVINLAAIVAVVGFCIGMRWFCQDTGLQRSARGWLKTMVVFCCSCFPVAISQFLMLLVVLKIIQNPSSLIQGWPWWYLLNIPLMVAPPLAFLLSILQMRGQMMRRELL